MVAPLFPGFVPARAPTALILLGRNATPAVAARGSRRRPVLAIAPGLLRLPPIRAGLPWLSGTVAHAARAGIVSAGWCAQALGTADPGRRARAATALAALSRARVGGAFWAAALPVERQITLVCLGPDAGPAACERALAAALAGSAAADIVVLAEASAPAMLTSMLAPMLAPMLARARRHGCTVLRGPHDPWSAIARATALHLAGDPPIGLLALFAGCKLHHHSPAWYEAADPIDAAAAWLAGTRHADPYTGRETTCEASIALLAEWRPLLAGNRGIACCVGVSAWKRRRIAGFFHDGEHAPPFRRRTGDAVALARRSGGAIAVWNSRIPAGLVEAAAAAGVALRRVEDGFVRSVGLGSDFLPPSSIVADGAGIYYDPRTPSDLEQLLAGTVFEPALLARAGRLIERLRAGGVTKYGAGSTAAQTTAETTALSHLRRDRRRLLLVPGQVADDLSVQLGAGAIRTNLQLLRHVREKNPAAIVIFKPHPDVEAGHRPGAVAEADLRRHADHVIRGGAMSALIDAVDEVHTLTSLAGFEALLRQRIVCVYGQPFYAGWGLTRDHAPLPRRVRRLSLEELAACVLILYPRYLDPLTGLPCGPECLIDRLAQPDLWRPGWLMRARQMQGQLRRIMGRLRQPLQSGTPAAEIDVADIG